MPNETNAAVGTVLHLYLAGAYNLSNKRAALAVNARFEDRAAGFCVTKLNRGPATYQADEVRLLFEALRVHGKKLMARLGDPKPDHVIFHFHGFDRLDVPLYERKLRNCPGAYEAVAGRRLTRNVTPCFHGMFPHMDAMHHARSTAQRLADELYMTLPGTPPEADQDAETLSRELWWPQA